MYFVTALAGLAGMASATSLVGLSADVEIASVAHANTDVSANSMSYCRWTKACSCPPGQKLDLAAGICVGTILTGPWPEPDISAYVGVDVELGSFCAASPTKIVKYNPHHKYCQASLDTITFCAPTSIELELDVDLEVDVEIDINAHISAELKNVCAALFGLYIETLVDAVIAFNTDILGLATVAADIEASVSLATFKSIEALQGPSCKLGLGKCNVACVGYCTKGCKNYIEVGAEVGASIHGLVGFCILPKVILTLNAAKHIVAHVVDGLLCLVGGLIKTVLSTFDCHCH
ncbi:hypothetical protein E4U43_007893 [Claviceps pusilla]|uniref:Secreted protein n=1 Tax=Claviceps pusilla TaxID=123648 RepID=A0A9P7NDQ9_9HYPO|nr:hypothetical protein E4U43_007893 [Claviceps pusilla]